jgi:hypothetical protein
MYIAEILIIEIDIRKKKKTRLKYDPRNTLNRISIM